MVIRLNAMVGLVVVFAAGSALAQEKKAAEPPAAAGPPVAKMSPEGRKYIDGWLGKWSSSDATLTAGDQKMTGGLKVDCEKVSSGWGTLCRATFSFKGMPPMTNTFLMGWDLGTQEAHMFEVSDAGEVHNHAGKWTDDKSVSLVHQGKTFEGKDEKDACTATWASAKEMKLECVGTQGAATMWTFSANSKKK